MTRLSSPTLAQVAQATAPTVTLTSQGRATPLASGVNTEKPNVLRRLGRWFKHLFHRRPSILCRLPPNVVVSTSPSSITIECASGTKDYSCTPSPDSRILLIADAQDPDLNTLMYVWAVTGGKIIGEGRNVTWDLKGAAVGTYAASVTVNDGNNHTATSSTVVTVVTCPNCRADKEKP